jgi:hypothetical protein
MNPEIRKEMAARMLQTGSILDGVFPKWSGGWQRGNTPGLTLAVAVRKEELDSSEQSFSFFVRGVAGSLPPTTAIVGAERRIVKGRPMFIVKMVDKSADGVVTTFHVTVPARQRILTFLFSTQRDLGAATWQECTAVLNGLEEE